MTKRVPCAGGVVLNSSGQILLVNQNGNSWSLPKGHIDEGEDALAAAKREIYEESGVSQVEHLKDLGAYERYRIGLDGKDDLSELKTIHMFLFKTSQNALKPVDPKNPEARWMSAEEAVKLLTHRKDREFLKSVSTQLKNGK
ncbi:MAG: NUDIX domain-containing protein [Candidatus Omnitrophica bacterium]|nr:NUDIX domain-containing protein [Candidatus Omnitrophota bacterium]